MSTFRKVGIVAAAAALTTLAVVPAFVVRAASTTPTSAASELVAALPAAGPVWHVNKSVASSANASLATLGDAVPFVEPVMPAWPKKRCTVDNGPVHFRTPEATMRYLAAAWNCADIHALRHVTTADSRGQLQWMQREAKNLKLVSCTAYGLSGHHSFSCNFTHDYPRGVGHDNPTATGKGQAWLTVRPARRPGWYVAADTCG